MAPSFVETPKGVMIIGTPGGSYIISMVLLGTLDYLDGMSAADVVKDARYHHQYLPDVVDYEKGALSADEIARLQAMGHSLKESSRRWGNMEVITWDYATGKVEAASDPRGEEKDWFIEPLALTIRRSGLVYGRLRRISAGRQHTNTSTAVPGRIASPASCTRGTVDRPSHTRIVFCLK